MIISEEIKGVVESSAYISLITVNADGTPHPIAAGKGEVDGETIVFGIYKMDITQNNLKSNDNAWVVAATMESGPKGYRLNGTAQVKEKQLIFSPVKAEELI